MGEIITLRQAMVLLPSLLPCLVQNIIGLISLRLVKQRMTIAGQDPSDCYLGSPKLSTLLNQYYSIVGKKFFQERVQAWLRTVRKDVFDIEHYWIGMSLLQVVVRSMLTFCALWGCHVENLPVLLTSLLEDQRLGGIEIRICC
jgi:hypothetical protein